MLSVWRSKRHATSSTRKLLVLMLLLWVGLTHPFLRPMIATKMLNTSMSIATTVKIEVLREFSTGKVD